MPIHWSPPHHCLPLAPPLQVNLPIISAILTVFSYALNDCVVVFDRIRYELGCLPEPPRDPRELRDTVNRAMGLVTIRSLLTLAVVMVCSVCLVGLGPEGLESFSLAITFGLLNATYTTILLCAPLWYLLRRIQLRWQQRRTGGGAGGSGSSSDPDQTVDRKLSQPGTPGSKLNGSSVGSFQRMYSTGSADSSAAAAVAAGMADEPAPGQS